MFGFLKKNKKQEIVAPASGTIEELSALNDGVFSSGMMGPGFAVEPTAGEIVAPVDGTVVSVFPTKHALSFTDDNGHEILLHLGIDTVELKGGPFEINVSAAQKVKQGDVLGKMDLALIKEKGKKASVILVFTNVKDKPVTLTASGKVEKGSIAAKI